jgi:FkbM family methyltransferase
VRFFLPLGRVITAERPRGLKSAIPRWFAGGRVTPPGTQLVDERLLVWPVRVCRPGRPQRIRDRVVPTLLRGAVGVSRSVFRGRGVGFACIVAARLIGSSGQISFQLGAGGWFLVPTDDRYWLQFLLVERSYELELDRFLQRTVRSDDLFLDCGANLGLWSVAIASIIHDPERVVAVEAGSLTFARLIDNWEGNDRCFTALHRAVSNETGTSVSFFASARDHAAATLVEGLAPSDAEPETISTVSLLDLARERMRGDVGGRLVFVKLDIEGAERQVLANIDPDEHGNFVILYEDHGRDPMRVTAFLLERGFAIAFLADDGSVERIRQDSLHRLDGILNPTRGYNLLAVGARGVAASRLAALYPTLELG